MPWGVIIAVGIIVVLALIVIGIYNGLVQRRLRVDEALGQIEVQLKRRWDLIPNLINAVKGYMGFEQSVLENVTNARANAVAAGAKGPAEQAIAENALTSSLRSLFAVVENYPDLKANQNVLSLQEELTTTENQISFSRQHYNATVLDYNTNIQTFPSVLIAGMFGFIEARVLRRRAGGRDAADRRPDPAASRLSDRGRSRRGAAHRGAGSTMSGSRPTFYHQIAVNRRRSVLLALIVAGLLGLLGFGIGYAWGGDVVYGIPVLVGVVILTLIVSIGTYFAGDGLVLAASQAHEVTDQEAPQLLNVVRELSMAAGIPAPQGLRHRRHGAQRLRHRPRPEARLDRHHDRPAREARSRGAAGRHRPRALARPQPRHPLRAPGRRPGRLGRAAGRHVPALQLLGRHGRTPLARLERRGRGPGHRHDPGPPAGHPGARSRPGSSSSRSAGSASTWPTPRRSRSPATRTAWSAPCSRSRRTRRSSRSPTGPPSTSTSSTPSSPSRSAPRASSRPTRRSSTGSTGCAR